MAWIELPFHLPGFVMERVDGTETGLCIDARASAPRAYCPRCHQASARVHSYYTRSPRDLPIGEYAVRLRLHVRRFRCVNQQCLQQTFAERIPDVVPVQARRTARLTAALEALAFTAGGEAGAR